MFSSNYCFLTCIQISQEAGKVVWYSQLLNNFPQFVVIHTGKGFSLVNDVFLDSPDFFVDVVKLMSGSSVFSKSSLTSGSVWFKYCWSLAWRIFFFKLYIIVLVLPNIKMNPPQENFEHYFTSVWDECNCAVVWEFFGIAFLWDWNENGHFPVLWPLLSFPNLLSYWVQHFHSIIF